MNSPGLDRRGFLAGVSSVALAVASSRLPVGPTYLRGLVVEYGRQAQMGAWDAWYTRWERMTALYANHRGVEIAHTGTRALVPEGMTDWRQATAEEIFDDIERMLDLPTKRDVAG